MMMMEMSYECIAPELVGLVVSLFPRYLLDFVDIDVKNDILEMISLPCMCGVEPMEVVCRENAPMVVEPSR